MRQLIDTEVAWAVIAITAFTVYVLQPPAAADVELTPCDLRTTQFILEKK